MKPVLKVKLLFAVKWAIEANSPTLYVKTIPSFAMEVKPVVFCVNATKTWQFINRGIIKNIYAKKIYFNMGLLRNLIRQMPTIIQILRFRTFMYLIENNPEAYLNRKLSSLFSPKRSTLGLIHLFLKRGLYILKFVSKH
jgi:hypothetical protein